MTRHAPRSRPPLLLAALLTLTLTACGGTGSTDGSGSANGSGSEPATVDTVAVDPAPVDPAPGDTSAADSASADIGVGSAPADTADWVLQATGEPSEVGSARGTLAAARTGRHTGYDRLVLEFRGRVPGYRIDYPDEPLRQCGSGRPVEVDAPSVLHITLRRAAAHDEDGVTIEARSLRPALEALRSARLICDFEGYVEWAIGVEEKVPFRVLRLDNPARLVVDIRHP